MATRFDAQQRLVMDTIHDLWKDNNAPILISSEDVDANMNPARFKGIIEDLIFRKLIKLAGKMSLDEIKKASTTRMYFLVYITPAFLDAWDKIRELPPIPIKEIDTEAEVVVAKILYNPDTDRVELKTGRERRILAHPQHDSNNAQFLRYMLDRPEVEVSRSKLNEDLPNLKKNISDHISALGFTGNLREACFHITRKTIKFWPHIRRGRLAQLNISELSL